MSTEDAEKLIKYLLKTYDKNHDGRFDYAGWLKYDLYLTLLFFLH